MTDIALRQASLAGSPPGFDIAIGNGDLARDEGLRTAVVLSLFLDRRAENDDALEGGDVRGSWMDQYLEHGNDRLGSRLWLLAREKETAATLARARSYCEEALAWMLEDGIARAIETEAEWVRSGMLGLRVTITLPDGSRWEERLHYPIQGG